MPQLEFDAASQSKMEFIESVIEFCKPFFDEALGFDFSKNDCLKIAYCKILCKEPPSRYYIPQNV